jgi:hypothetical protein
MKIPPGFGTNKPQITCPKCGKVYDVPMQQVAAAIGAADGKFN